MNRYALTQPQRRRGTEAITSAWTHTNNSTKIIFVELVLDDHFLLMDAISMKPTSGRDGEWEDDARLWDNHLGHRTSRTESPAFCHCHLCQAWFKILYVFSFIESISISPFSLSCAAKLYKQKSIKLAYWSRFSIWHSLLSSCTLLSETSINRTIQRS